MVRGVAFFGTPFQGSRNADFLSPFATFVAGITRANTNFLEDMRTYSSDLPELMMIFNNVKTEEDIEVLLFIEKKNDGPTRVVCRPNIAIRPSD